MMKEQIFVTKSSLPSYEKYCEAIKPLWESHWLTNMGKYHQELERKLGEYLNASNVSLMVNGHMALELAIQSFGFMEGSEVITTPFTFVSTTHAIVRNRLEPVFCDVKESDGTIDEDRIEELITPKTVAILPVHVYGNVCNVEAIQQIADKYGLKVIYDAAHAFGEVCNGNAVGNFGDVSIFSFHATKVYNTIEGGAVVCNNREVYDKLYNLKNFGIRGEELVVSVGANAKMNEFSAIMGLLNLERFPDVVNDRKRIYKKYESSIANIKGIRILKSKGWKECALNKSNYAYVPIVLDEYYPISRDELYVRCAEDDIHLRKYFYPISTDHTCFKNRYKDIKLPIARDLSKRVLTLPIYEAMTDGEIDRVINQIEDGYRGGRVNV